MKLKFSIGPGNTLVTSVAANVCSSEYLKSNFFYLFSSENGIAPNPKTNVCSETNYVSDNNLVGSVAENSQYLKRAGAPEKISNAEIQKVLNENLRSVIGLFNFEDVKKGEEMVATAAAEGVSNADQSLYAVSVYKKEIWYDREAGKSMEEPVWTPVVLNESSNIIRDFNIGNNRYYKYVFRLVENKADGGLEYQSGVIVPIKTNWQGWSITELHETDDPKVFTASPKDVWKFKYNISNGAQTQNVTKTQQDTLSRYPIFSHGVKNAVSGSVTCLLGREMINANYTNKEWVYEQDPNTSEPSFIWVENNGPFKNLGGYRERLGRVQNFCGTNSDYLSASVLGFRNLTSNEAVDMLDKWRDVCYSGNPKLLKDQKGQTFIIQITDPSNTTNESWEKMPEEISFSWIEIADAKDCRIIQAE